MTQYDNSNSGVLFREREKKSEKAPDMRGKLNVDGKDYELAGWTRESKNGVKFLSLKVQEPRQKQDRPAPPPAPPSSFDEPDDSLPF